MNNWFSGKQLSLLRFQRMRGFPEKIKIKYSFREKIHFLSIPVIVEIVGNRDRLGLDRVRNIIRNSGLRGTDPIPPGSGMRVVILEVVCPKVLLLLLTLMLVHGSRPGPAVGRVGLLAGSGSDNESGSAAIKWSFLYTADSHLRLCVKI